MKIKSIVIASILVGSLNIVGCQSTQETTEEPKVTYEYNTDLPVEEYKEDSKESEIGWNCVNCGKWHTENESFYNEDGMSACSKECFVAYTGTQPSVDPSQGNCDPVIDTTEADLYEGKSVAAACDTCGTTTIHPYGYTEIRKSGLVLHLWFCENCGNKFILNGGYIKNKKV